MKRIKTRFVEVDGVRQTDLLDLKQTSFAPVCICEPLVLSLPRGDGTCLPGLLRSRTPCRFWTATFGGGVVARSCPTLVTPWTVARQAPLSMGFSPQECWSGLPFPSLGDLSHPGVDPGSPALQADSLLTEPPGILTAQFTQTLKERNEMTGQACDTNPKHSRKFTG